MLRSIRVSSSLSLAALIWTFSAFSASPPVAITTASPGVISVMGAAGSLTPLLSADGRFVVFSSLAADLVTNDFNNALDVFMFARESGKVSLVSVNYAGTASANGRSLAVDMSTNGRWVLFESTASDVVANDTNGLPDLFLRDMTSGETKIVSVNLNGTPASGFRNAALSPDGRFLLFESPMPNLVTNTSYGIQVYLRDLETGNNMLVSVSTNVDSAGNSTSCNAVMTPDGRWVAFQSRATSLSASDTNYNPDIYLRDMQAGTTMLVSATPVGTGSTNVYAVSDNPSISDDGQYVAFESTATDLVATVSAAISSGVYLRDVAGGTTAFISAQTDDGSATRPIISSEGRFVGYECSTNLYCWDRTVGASFLLSTNYAGSGGADGPCHSPQFTPDSRYCVFLSSATNLVPTTASRDQCRVYRRDMQTGEIVLFGGDLGPSAAAGDWASVSEDGNIVAFQSSNSESSSNDLNEAADVFICDLVAGSTRLVSCRDEQVAAVTANGRSAVGPNCLSSDGRYLLFSSFARNLLDQPTSGQQNFYARDLWTGSNQLVTAAWNGAECGNGAHYAASLSGDGRWAVFQSSATNLVANDTNKSSDIFVRDLRTQTNYLGSLPWRGAGLVNNQSISPAISDNGRFITFQSVASDLVTGDFPGSLDAFLRDMTQGTNFTLSTLYSSSVPCGGQTNFGNGAYNPFTPKLTPDGQWAVVWSRNNLSTNAPYTSVPPYCFARNVQRLTIPIGVYTNASFTTANSWLTIAPGGRFAVFGASSMYKMIGIYDFLYQTNCLAVSGTSGHASLSADGRLLAFEGRASSFGTNSANTISDIFILDRASNTVRLASFSPSSRLGGNGPSSEPVISADGRYLVFKSKASDFFPGHTNGVSDIYVRDLTTGSLFALSCAADGTFGNRVSGNAILGPDGRTLVFESFASNLLPGDINETKDVFVLRLPTESANDFRILALTSLGTGTTTVSWNSVPGRTYRLQYNENISNPSWTELPDDIVATSDTTSKTDDSAGAGRLRFYRVRLVN